MLASIIDQLVVLSPAMTPTAILNFSVAAVIWAIGLAVFLRNSRNLQNTLFLLVAVNVGFWIFAATMSDVSRDVASALVWARLAIVGPFFAPAFFLLFSVAFPADLRKIGAVDVIVALIPSMAIIPFLASRHNIADVRIMPWGTEFVPGVLYVAIFFYLIAYFFLSARNLYFSWYHTEDSGVKKQITLAFSGMIIMVLLGIVTNLMLPLIFNYSRVSVFGPASGLFFIAFIGYAILKHRMMDLKIVVVEVLVILLALFGFVNLIISDSVAEFILRSLLLVVTAMVGVFLIRSVRLEARRYGEIQALAEELRVSNAQLREANQMKSEFISIASHQLRTPVSVIKGYLSLIRDGVYGKVGGQMREKLQQVFDMNERLVHLISNFLNLSRIERGGFDFYCHEINLDDVVEQAVAEMMGEARTKGLAMSFRRPPKPTPTVWADTEKVHETLANLIDNAVKYTLSGSVTVTVSALPDKAVVRVADTGVGMDADDLQHVFEKYFRRHKPDPTSQSGMSMGLGLFICARFVRDMGGDIWVEKTAPGQGTTMAFSLPFAPVGACAPQKPPAPDDAKRL